MDEPELLKKRKKKGLLDKPDDKSDDNSPGNDEPELFEELDVDLGSDHPVHEKFVDEKGLREMKKKRAFKQ